MDFTYMCAQLLTNTCSVIVLQGSEAPWVISFIVPCTKTERRLLVGSFGVTGRTGSRRPLKQLPASCARSAVCKVGKLSM